MPAAAGRIEDEVAGIGGHEQAALDDLGDRLHDVELLVAEADRLVSSQMFVKRLNREVIEDTERTGAYSRSAMTRFALLTSRSSPIHGRLPMFLLPG